MGSVRHVGTLANGDPRTAYRQVRRPARHLAGKFCGIGTYIDSWLPAPTAMRSIDGHVGPSRRERVILHDQSGGNANGIGSTFATLATAAQPDLGHSQHVRQRHLAAQGAGSGRSRRGHADRVVAAACSSVEARRDRPHPTPGQSDAGPTQSSTKDRRARHRGPLEHDELPAQGHNSDARSSPQTPAPRDSLPPSPES